jgi:hypothetical protein
MKVLFTSIALALASAGAWVLGGPGLSSVLSWPPSLLYFGAIDAGIALLRRCYCIAIVTWDKLNSLQ